MKNLLILRHAAPESTGPDGTDFSRRLTDEGERQAEIQGKFLKEADIIPDLIVTSPAVRAVSTAELVLDAMGRGPEVIREESLYNAPGDELLDYIVAMPDSAETALLVAHMPGVAELLNMLTIEFGEMGVVFNPFKLAVVLLQELTSWADMAPGAGELQWLLPPLLLKE